MMKKAGLVFIVAVCVVVIVAILRLEGRRNQRNASDVGVGTNVVRTATPVRRSGEGSPETEVVLEKSSAALSPVLVRLEPGHPKPAHIVKAQKDGAQAKITFLVVDDKGRPVPDATVAGGFYNHERDGHGFSSQTQNDGTVELTDICVWEINYGVEKSGYYETRGRYDFYKAGFDCVKDGRWIPWNPTVEVVLKRKVNPVAMYVRPNRGGLNPLVPPVKDESIGFDLQKGDWVAPHGKGDNTDVFFKYEYEAGVPLVLNYRGIVSLVFTNKYDGAYVLKKDKSSAFQSVYQADTNAVYISDFEFAYDRLAGDIKKDTRFSEADYLVIRTRSKTDEKGNLVSAHYSKMYGPIAAGKGGIYFGYYFNPNENDPNLEADTSRNLLNPGKLDFVP